MLLKISPFCFFKDFAKDRYGVSAMVQSQQKLG